MTSEQQSQPPPSEDQTGGNGNGSPCGKDVIALELTEKMRNEQLVSNIFSSYRSKSLIVMLNHKYENKPINLPILDDWKSTHDGFYDILVDNGVAEEDSRRIQRFCSSQHEAIIDHFAQQTLAHMSVGQRAKKERIEKAKNGPPIDVTIAQALTMHEGNVRVKGMISTGSDKMEKMITRVYFRCGECDHYNTLVDYMDTNHQHMNYVKK